METLKSKDEQILELEAKFGDCLEDLKQAIQNVSHFQNDASIYLEDLRKLGIRTEDYQNRLDEILSDSKVN